MGYSTVEELSDGITGGDRRAISRGISLIENRSSHRDQLLDSLYGKTGKALRIGVTGPPGSGKSTLVTELAERFAGEEHPVGVVAVDPSSPFTGGALLGDRVRMGGIRDPLVFIRSMASRGRQGGLAPSTLQVCDLLDAAGKEIVLLETVGVGQSDVEVSSLVDVTLLILTPESGDSIQAMKAGLMEIGDLIIINKSDRQGADRVEHDVRTILNMRASSTTGEEETVPGEDPDESRTGRNVGDVEIFQTQANEGVGVEPIFEQLEQARAEHRKSGRDPRRQRELLHSKLDLILREEIKSALETDPAIETLRNRLIDQIESGAISPYGASRELMKEFRTSSVSDATSVKKEQQ